MSLHLHQRFTSSAAIFLFIVGMVLFSVACSSETSDVPTVAPTESTIAQVPTETAAPVELTAIPPTDAPTEPPPPTVTDVPTELPATATDEPATATAEPATPTAIPPTPEPAPTDLALTNASIRFYPYPDLYEGDIVSLEVLPFVPENIVPWELDFEVRLNGETVNWSRTPALNFSRQAVFRYEWQWDTSGLVGDHVLEVVVDPDDEFTEGDEVVENNVVRLPITILAEGELPPNEAVAEWVTSRSEHVNLYTIAGSAADRDSAELLALAERAMADAATSLSLPLPDVTLEVYLIDRVIGQGGFVSGQLTYVLSYLDRHYAGNDLYQVLLHETIHVLDAQYISPEGGTGLLSEGLAVWASGGHYRVEDVMRRTAALVETDLYIPFDQLIDNFYPSQHEIGYLQGAAFVGFLDDVYGWESTAAFMNDTNGNGSELDKIDRSAETHFNKGIFALEEEFIVYLGQLSLDPDVDWQADVVTTIRLYDTMRDYQTAYDTVANYLFGWLMAPQIGLENGITSYWSRRPEAEVNLTMEALLVSAQSAWTDYDYDAANELLNAVDSVLETGSYAQHPLAQTYNELVQISAEAGYEVQQIALEDGAATVLVHEDAPSAGPSDLYTLTFTQQDNDWILAR